MPQRRSHRSRSLALGGALAALAVVGGGTVVAVTGPTEVTAGEIRLAQNVAAQQMQLGAPVDLDLEPVVARAAGGTIPAGTTVQVTGLPDGLVQNGWVISGTPTRAGEYEVLVTVSNSGVSRSQKVAIEVTEEPAAAAPAAAAEGGAGEGEADDEGATTTPTTTTTPSAADSPQAEPTLSATPGVSARGGAAAAQAGDEADDEADGGAGTAPDLCSVLGDGELDGSSLTQLLPALTGGDDAASSGLVLVILNAVVGLLPSVLGESGSMESLGSAGQLLCTLQPSVFGGQAPATTTPATTTPAGATTTATAPALDPTALLGLLTGAGSAE